MNKTCIKGFLCLLVSCLLALLSIQPGQCGLRSSYSFTEQELDNLLAPIALYPDPLLAEILPGSTYPEEVAEAAAWLSSGGDSSGIDEQNWDEAVRAVAHYPNILFMMSGDMDWTAHVGDAFLNQPEDVAKSIQRLRWRARAMGNLVGNHEQTVVIEGDYIQIIPTQPQYIYVPQYDPAVVYVQRPAPGIGPFIAFGFGLAIGGWLSMDFDWHQHHVVYHGWNRHGWVNNARPYVHVTNVYINRSRPYINQAWRHDASHGGPDRYRVLRPATPYRGGHLRLPDARGRVVTPPRGPRGVFGYKRDAQLFSNRGRESLGAIKPRMTPTASAVRQGPTKLSPGLTRQPAGPTPSPGQMQAAPPGRVSKPLTKPAPGIGQQPSAPTSSARPQPATPAPNASSSASSAFGGYRGASEARAQSLRGQASRQSNASATSPPASRGSAPAGKTVPKGKQDPQR
jgi:hypothetical protein